MIFSSSSSTAGIAILFFPSYSIIPALLGGFVTYSQKKYLKVIFAILLTISYGVIIKEIISITKINTMRKQEHAADKVKFEKNRKWVKEVEQLGSKEAIRVFREKINSTTDRTLLIPIAKSKLLPVDLLKQLSQSQSVAHLGLVLTVARHPNATGEILQDIFNNKQYPDYFFSALSKHPNTPKKILYKIYAKGNKHQNLYRLPENPNLPEDLIEKVLNSKNALYLGNLARNKAMDCKIVIQARKNIESLDKDTKYLSTGLGRSKKRYQSCMR